jgi:hypothetical protein
MTVLEAYCDICCLPAPAVERVGGSGDGQAVRELFTAYHRALRERHGWRRTLDCRDLCPDCAAEYRGRFFPDKLFHRHWGRHRPATAVPAAGEPGGPAGGR